MEVVQLKCCDFIVVLEYTKFTSVGTKSTTHPTLTSFEQSFLALRSKDVVAAIGVKERGLGEKQRKKNSPGTSHLRKNEPLCQPCHVEDAVRCLWHGTSAESLKNIVVTGFNRAYCGLHGTR